MKTNVEVAATRKRGEVDSRPGRTKTAACPLGFTLVELLVVIAIILLLVSLLMPSLTLMRESARRAVCSANLHHIALSQMLYAEDNESQTTRLCYNGTSWVDNHPGGYGNENPIWGYAAWFPDLQYHGRSGPVGPGLLIGEYLPQQGGYFYCPSQFDYSHIYLGNRGWANWGRQISAIPGPYQGYQSTVVMGSWARRSQRIAGEPTALHSDLWYWYHYRSSSHTGINVAYTDASVHWIEQGDCEFWVLGLCNWTGRQITDVWEFLDEQF